MASQDHNFSLLHLLFIIIFIISSFQVLPASPTPFHKLESAIRSINRRGPYVGLVTVVETEEDAFMSSVDFRPDPTTPFLDLSGRRFRIGKIHGKKVVYVRCGEGMVNAAAATQQMIDVFSVKGIVHFGIAGNINNSMSIGDVSIPKQITHAGLWEWLNPDKAKLNEDAAYLDVGNYNIPQGEGKNELGSIGYSYEELYSVTGNNINTPQKVFWINTTQEWLHLAADHLEGMELLQCVNSSLCLPEKPKLVVGLKAATANIFVDNAAYRNFLHDHFGVSSSDMESSAVAMTCVSNGYPIIVIRGLSDLAGVGDSTVRKFGSLAAINAAKAVLNFIKNLPPSYNTNYY